jgi:hypothetical protein
VKQLLPYFTVIIVCSLTSCVTTKPLETQVLQVKANSLTATPAIARLNIVKKASDSICSCITPVPDAAYNSNDGFNLGVTSNLGKEQTGFSEGETETGLGGRSPNVLITREMYFRLCEFLSNGTYSKETKVELFKATLKAITLLNKNDLGKGTVDQTSSLTTGSDTEEIDENELYDDEEY